MKVCEKVVESRLIESGKQFGLISVFTIAFIDFDLE